MKILLILIAPFVLLTACDKMGNYETGNGDIVTKTIPVTGFNELVVSGSFDVILVESDSAELSITTDNNLHEYIEIEQDGEELKIKSTKNLRSTRGVEIKIGYQELQLIESGGASMISNRGVLLADNLTINMAGAGAMKMRLEADQLRMNISGAGSIELEGRVRQQAIKLSGAGGLDASQLISEYAEVDISGVGGAKVNVTETLNASVSGVGGVTYFGNPKEVRKDISGLGNVSKKN